MVDSSLLSDAKVVAATRKWICIRPLTYEDKTESDYLKTIFAPRGRLENTVFALMDSDATKFMSYPSRTPHMLWPESPLMAQGLNEMAKPFTPKSNPSALPTVKSLRFALNVAACDNRMAAIIVSDPKNREQDLKVIRELAWSPSNLGQFTYVVIDNTIPLSVISNRNAVLPSEFKSGGILFVAPGEFGTNGSALSFAKTTDSKEQVQAAINRAYAAFKPLDQSDHLAHLRRGVQQGIRWRPLLPVEDAQAQQATDRLWGSGN